MLTQCIATQYGRQGIRANAIAPGGMTTPSYVADADSLGIAAAERLLDRPGTPDDFASLAVFLTSDDAAFITGQTIVMDGGLMARRPSHAVKLWRESQL